MRIALYARVSTQDKGQDPTNQLVPMRERCLKESWEVFKEYVDQETGRDFDRPALQAMLEDARHHKFDCIYFWSLDRFSRAGVFPTIRLLNELKDVGVKVLSHEEYFINTMGDFGDVLISLFAWMAQQESKHHGERVRRGIATAREKGTKSGKPFGHPKKQLDIAKVAELRSQGQSLRTIAKQFNVSYVTVYNALKKYHEIAPTKEGPQEPQLSKEVVV